MTEADLQEDHELQSTHFESMKLRFLIFTLFFVGLCGATTLRANAQVKLAQGSKSTFTIVIPTEAPTSVKNAATELQKDIELATGAKLPLQKDNATVSTPVISLGSTQQAKTAGFSSEKMADESYRIVTKGGNLYVLGSDTPDGGWTKNNGTSNGTANGVYSFLEEYLNVRWLMPGDLGRDVPHKSTLTLPKIDRTVTPKFSMRRVTQITNYADAAQRKSIEEWSDRHKVGVRAGATNYDFGHNWWEAVNYSGGWEYGQGTVKNDVITPQVRALYEKHPEWFAMDADGNRPYPKNHQAKFETTNPELVKWFAEVAIESLKKDARPAAFSLSPSDSAGWSQSPESKALYDPYPPYATQVRPNRPVVSSLIAKWYHDIAEIVAKEYPQGKLAGYIYADYIYPPTKFKAPIADNFTPQLAPLGNYGYRLYRDDVQKYFRTVSDEWAKIITGDWFYYDLPNQLLYYPERDFDEYNGSNFPAGTGTIIPVAPEILNLVFPQLLKSHIAGTEIYGVPAWSNAAMSNYIIAKMTWEPTLNAFDVQREWLHRAYGPAAGAAMEEFYTKLDGWFRDHYRGHEEINYRLTTEMFSGLYGAHYAKMEKLFLRAKQQQMTEPQKQRLQLIEDNLIVLQWRLRNAGLLPVDFASPLQRNDAQINSLIASENSGFPLFPGAATVRRYNDSARPLPWKVTFSKEAQPADKSTSPQWSDRWVDSKFLLYAAQDGDIRITTESVTHGVYFAAYEVWNQRGQLVATGIFNTEVPIVIPAKANESYLLTIPSRKPSNFQLQVQNAVVASGQVQDKTLILSGKPAPVYILYIPGRAEATMSLADADGGAQIKKPLPTNIAARYMAERFEDASSYPLDEGWKFAPDPANDGIKRGVTKADFDDSDWASISPLEQWQLQGHNYHGVAWYRLKFQGKPLQGEEVTGETESAQLYFGAIDGDAEIYLNGKPVGGHRLKENFAGWNEAFARDITKQILPGENTLVIQVTSKNDQTASGLHKGVVLITGKLKAK